MKLRIGRRIAISIVILAASVVGQASRAFSDVGLYDQVVDHLFHHDLNARPAEMLLRYTSDESGEMQILIRDQDEKSIDVQVWGLPPGSASIWNQLAALPADQAARGVNEVASHISVYHIEWTVAKSTALAQTIENEHPTQTALVPNDNLTVDGVQYELKIASLSRTVSLTLTGPEEPVKTDDPVVRWMARVRSQVEPVALKHAQSKP
jgi:hypothetical protein